MLDFNEYKEDFGKLFPTYSEEEQKEAFDLLVDFWEWLIKNFDKFFDIDKLKELWYLKTNPTDEQLN